VVAHADFVVMPNEIVVAVVAAGIGIAVAFHASTPKLAVEPMGSWKDAEVDVIAAVAADDFVVFDSADEAVESVELESMVLASVHTWSGLVACIDAEQTMIATIDVARQNFRRAEELAAVVVSDTFGGHFVDNAEISFVEFAVDVELAEWIHTLVAATCLPSSHSAETNKRLAFVLGPEDSQSCVVDN